MIEIKLTKLEDKKLTRTVLIEKIPFYVKISIKPGYSGWWYSLLNENVFKVRRGGKNDLRFRTGYTEHLTKYGFYVICSGKYIGDFISRKDAIKI